jgi:hypothetical protein
MDDARETSRSVLDCASPLALWRVTVLWIIREFCLWPQYVPDGEKRQRTGAVQDASRGTIEFDRFIDLLEIVAANQKHC